MGIFKKKGKETGRPTTEVKKEAGKAGRKDDQDLWVKCSSCGETLYKKELERNLQVCPKCSYHFPLTVDDRIELTFDRGTFKELFAEVEPVDFLKFHDTKSYKSRLAETRESMKRNDAVVCGRGKVDGVDVLAAIFDFNFMGGSLGSVVGEKITRLLEEGVRKRLPVMVFCASGGARMQEGILSLMQMSKVAGAIYRLKREGIPYISILTDPTLGGVSASVGMLGDIIIGEPKAMIGFAGPRVIRETIKEELPHGFQRSEYLLEHGMMDMILARKDFKQKLGNLLSLLTT